MRSLRKTLIAKATIRTALILLGAGVILYLLVRARLVRQFDKSLIDSAELLASMVEQQPQGIYLEFREFDTREFDAPGRPGYLEIWRADGSVVFRSPSLGHSDMSRPADPLESPICSWVTLADGVHGRAVAIAFLPRPDPEEESPALKPGDSRGSKDLPAGPATLVLARSTVKIENTLTDLKMLLGLVGLLTVVASAAAIHSSVAQTMQPLTDLAGQIGRLDADDLSARIELPDTPAELRPVVDRLNDLLGRLDGALERERAFSADVAHELRTPLAGLRSTLDVALLRNRETAEYQAVLRDCLQIAVQLQGMMENLLSLARLEAGQVCIQPEPVSPNTVLRDGWKSLAQIAERKDLRVEWDVKQEGTIATDPVLFGLVIRNILENAAAYADAGGSVRIGIAFEPTAARIHVANTGSKVTQDEVEHVFQRFWRGDPSRSDAGIHCGLGLPLVKEAMDVLNGAVVVRSEYGGEFAITVSFPFSERHVPPRSMRLSVSAHA